MKTENNKITLSAINPFKETYIVENKEIETSKDFVSWGEKNDYPNYLYNLYINVPTLGALINSTVDYVLGDSISFKFNNGICNKKNETIDEIIKYVVSDLILYGNFAIQVIRNMLNEVTEIYHIPIQNLRSNKKNDIFYYSENWGKTWGRVKYLTLPKFSKDDENKNSVFFYKNTKNTVYGHNMWESAIIAAEIEKSINEFHLNEINNNFLSSKIINFNNGIPDDYLKEEIEKNINEKFSGKGNAGRIFLAYNDTADNAITVTDLSSDDFADRYNALAEFCKKQLFVGFRCTPNLIGYPDSTTGFNEQEYQSAFKLFNKTVIQPIQRNIIRSFEKIFGDGCLQINSFTL